MALAQGGSMRRPTAALFPIGLALGAIVLATWAGAQAQDGREEGPIGIEKCQTIGQPGSYKLVKNLTFSTLTGTCLTIAADFVTIDLAGFTISGSGPVGPTAIAVQPPSGAGNLLGVAVRNGSISNFDVGVDLGSADGSIVEGLRVFGPGMQGIIANGIVRGNTVVGLNYSPGAGPGIYATGIVTGNYLNNNRNQAMGIGQGSTVIGNTVLGHLGDQYVGIAVACPSNVIDNTIVGFTVSNLSLSGDGCNNTNNVAP
jgi:hypothetical protein